MYSQADSLFVESQHTFTEGVLAARKRGSFESRHSDIENMEMMDASSITPGDLSQYLDLVSNELIAWDQYRIICQYVRGTETAILNGERNLSQVQKAMYQFYSPTPK